MTLTITPSKLAGTVTPPPSKSQAHRLLIAAALSGKEGIIHNLPDSQDIQATRRCMTTLRTNSNQQPLLDCGESGSTLRFLIPVALALRGGGVFTGRGRLMERPLQPYFDIFDEKGIYYTRKDGALTIKGLLEPGTYHLPGNVSSQFVTGLLYALPLVDGDSEIVLTTPLESRGYVNMTLEALEQFGVQATAEDRRFLVPGRQRYHHREVTVETDWSQAAFWFAARYLGSELEILGLQEHSTQGDAVIREYSRQMTQASDLDFDVSDCPDLAPPLAVMAALRPVTTRLVNAERLRIKESDRLASITAALTALGADVEEYPDSLTIHGKEHLFGGTVDCCNDHRIAMMAAVAATHCKEPVTLIGTECVAKSYPDFWNHYRMLGGNVYEHPGE